MNLPVSGRKEVHSEVIHMMQAHLANMYALMLRLQNFHWNVEGPNFYGLHALFEEKYTGLWKEVDVIAERIRALGEKAPGSFEEFIKLSLLADRPVPLDADGMLEELITCCVLIRNYTGETLDIAQINDDVATVDMLTKHIDLIDEMIWMFRSSLRRSSTTTSIQKSDSEKSSQVKQFPNGDGPFPAHH